MDSAPDGVYNKGMRPKNVRYPGGRLVHYRYGPEGSRDEMISRLATIHDDSDGLPGEVLSEYAYSGLGRMASERYPTPDVRLDYYQGTSPAAGQPSTASRQGYAGLDRYGRVKDQRWRYEGATPADLDRYAYGYDYGSNRLWRENMLTHGTANKFDEFYTYDGLSRLSNADRGTLDDPPWGGILAQVFRQKWGLDQMGNWDRFWQDNSDSGATWDIDQTRDHNAANEIESITDWITPDYDARGNMVISPKPGAETTQLDITYDAWNRQTKVVDHTSGNTLGEYRYDGLNRRIRKFTDKSGDNWTVREFYYNSSWQSLEERKDVRERTGPPLSEPEVATTPYAQYVWSARYIDAPVLRDRNNDENPDLEERFYFCNDANMNVTALVEPDGDVAERYLYTPYGQPTFLKPDWSLQQVSGHADGTASAYSNEILYCGYRFDPETGLYHVRERYYHPTLGRWMTRDSGYWDGMNLYEYGRSNPCVRVDPTGMIIERDQITDLAGFVSSGEAYIYTCACGWLDKSHITGWEKLYSTFRNAVDVAIRGNGSTVTTGSYNAPPRETSVRFRINPTGSVDGKERRATREDMQDIVLGMALYLFERGEANQIMPLEELLLGPVHPGAHSRYSLEDLPTNWTGLIIAADRVEGKITGPIDWKSAISERCHATLTKDQALCLYKNMTEGERLQKNYNPFPVRFDWKEPRWKGCLDKCEGVKRSPIFNGVAKAQSAFVAFVESEHEVVRPTQEDLPHSFGGTLRTGFWNIIYSTFFP